MLSMPGRLQFLHRYLFAEPGVPATHPEQGVRLRHPGRHGQRHPGLHHRLHVQHHPPGGRCARMPSQAGQVGTLAGQA